MSKVTQVVEMLRVAEASIKELEKLRSFGTVVHSADLFQSLTSKQPEKVEVSTSSWGQITNPVGTNTPYIGNQTEVQTAEPLSTTRDSRSELSAHAELQTIAEKLNQVIQLQDDVLSNLKADLDVLAIENHYLAKLNHTMTTDNENLLRMLESLELEAKELKEMILDMEVKESSKHLSESESTAEADTNKSRCESSTSNPKIHNSEQRHRSIALQTKSNGVYEQGETTRTMLGASRYQVFENTTVGETKRSVFVRAFLKFLRLYNNNK